MNKTFQINIEIQPEEEQVLYELSTAYGIEENKLFFMIIKTGFINGAKDYKSAFKTGIILQKKILDQLPHVQNLQNTANIQHAPANVVEQNLTRYSQNIKDDKLINEIKQGLGEK